MPTNSEQSNNSVVSQNGVNSDGYKINIKNVTPPITVSTEYTLQLLTKDSSPKVVDLGGMFYCSSNAEIIINSGSKCTIKALTNAEGPIIVYYKKDDQLLATRTIEVK